jgi:hypothetical protein
MIDPEQIDRLGLEAKVGRNAKSAFDIFFHDYIESKKVSLLSDFVSTSVDDSKKIFAIKHKVDAIVNLQNDINYLISAGEAAEMTIKEIGDELNDTGENDGI